MSTGDITRRPIPSRKTAWAAWMTQWLARMGVTPNQVSAAGLGFAMLAGVALALAPLVEGWLQVALLLSAPVLMGLRLIANMLDGLLAVEAGKGAADGPLWNELPDRVADIAVILGMGYGAGVPELGWAAACAALSTAYVRAVGDALSLEGGFAGPMGKPQRMVVLGAAAVIAAFTPGLWALEAGLWIALAGSVLTAGMRTGRLRSGLVRRAAERGSAPPDPS